MDDEASVREITQASLEEYSYHVVMANNGMEALRIYADRQREISAVLIDMMMPNLNGETAIRALKNINPDAKIIATSGLLVNRELAIKAGAEIFLLKPYTVRQLLKTLRKIIPSRENDLTPTSPLASVFVPSEDTDLCGQDLATMPRTWLQQMYDAAYCFDANMMLELIDQMPADQQAIASKLRELVLNFQTESIMLITHSLLET